MEKKMSAASGSSPKVSSRASIPNYVRKTILNMKEITRDHTDDEIYAMLKECGMDPNEAIERLLFQDPFHEVKRKRDKKKILDNKEPVTRQTPNMHGRGNRGGKINNSTRHTSHDTGGGRSSIKEEARSQVVDKPIFSSQKKRIKEENTPDASSVHAKPKSSNEIISGDIKPADILGTGIKHPASLEPGKDWISQRLPQHEPTDKKSAVAFEFVDVQRKPVSTSSNDSVSSAACFSASDPVLLPSDESRHPSAVGTIKREVGSQRSVGTSISIDNKIYAACEIVALPEPTKPQGNQKGQATELQSSASEIPSGSTGSRPSSNYSNHSQLAVGSQKGPSKEWKPKQMNIDPSQGSETPSAADITAKSSDVFSQSQLSTADTNEKASELQSKFEELHVIERKNVIIPTHIHVPESARFGLSFGSIDACFGVSTTNDNDVDSEMYPMHFSKTFHEVEEPVEEQPLSNQNTVSNVEGNNYFDRPQSPLQVPDNQSSGYTDVSSAAGVEINKTPETFLPHEGAQSSLVQQPLNPLNYSAQAPLYRSVSDIDGHVSPFGPQGCGAKSGNPAPQPSQSQQEVLNPLVQPTASPAPLVQTGVMQALPQHLLPCFRPPTGMHLSHYPPSYLPYGHYFPPYYLPGPPAIHQFLGNGAFPQQSLPTGGMYPPPTPPNTNSPAINNKYSFAQFKPGVYEPYGSSPPPGNPTNSDDVPDSQFKEGNTYMTGQNEGSTVWVTGPGPDLSNIPVSSFYNLPSHPQGQHVAFTQAQSGHNANANLYHPPGQAVSSAAVHPLLQPSQMMAGGPDMAVPTGNIYPQPSHPQANWANNY